MAKGLPANWGTLVPRFLLGVVFVFHGGRYLFGAFGAPPDLLEGLEGRIAGWGWPLPAFLARAVGVAEFFGGACLLVGLLTRFWGAVLAAVMAASAWKALPNGFVASGGGWEYPFVLAVLALSLAVQGGGAFSLDETIFRERPKGEGKGKE